MLDTARRRMVAVATAYLALASALMWPALPRMTSWFAGGENEAIRTMWTSWWWHDTLRRGLSPWSTEALSASPSAWNWTEPFNGAFAVLAWPVWQLWPGAPEPLLYNALLLATVWGAACAAYLLSQELWGGEWAPFLSGAVYAVCAYQVSLGIGRIELLALATSPLYLLGLVLTLRRHGVGAPLLAAAALAVTANASRSHLLFCALATLVVIGTFLHADWTRVFSPAPLRRLLLAAAVFVAAAASCVQWPPSQASAVAPGHELRSSLDLASFVVPGHVNLWGRLVEDGAPTSPGPAAYLGYALLLLTAVSLSRARASWPWVVFAGAGALLSLGPRLQVAGRTASWIPLPFGRFGTSLLGVTPAEFAWIVVLGLSIAVGGGLAWLVRSSRQGRLIALAAVVAVIAETWPRVVAQEPLPTPRFLRAVAQDSERWAVIDVTSPSRQQWNQMLHKHPVLDASNWERMRERRTASGRANALRTLDAMNVRFLIAADQDTAFTGLNLPVAYRGSGLVLLELPARPSFAVRLGSVDAR